jgi:hypothetical protein
VGEVRWTLEAIGDVDVLGVFHGALDIDRYLGER